MPSKKPRRPRGPRRVPPPLAITPEVMSTEETASYLRVPVSSVYVLIEREALPFLKFGTRLRFDRAALDAWRASRARVREVQA